MEKQGRDFDRGDIARNIAEKTGLDEHDVLSVLKALPSTLADALTEFGAVEYIGLGVFHLDERKARKGYDFASRETIEIPERLKVTFQAAPFVCEIVADRRGIDVY